MQFLSQFQNPGPMPDRSSKPERPPRLQGRGGKAAAKDDHSGGKGKSQGKGKFGARGAAGPNKPTRSEHEQGDSVILAALARTVHRAKKDPRGLIDKLTGLIKAAQAGKLTKPKPHRAMRHAKSGKGRGQDPAARDSGGGTKAPGITAAVAKRKIIAEESIDADYIRVSNQKEAQDLQHLAQTYNVKAKVGLVCKSSLGEEAKTTPLPEASGKHRTVGTWAQVALTAAGMPEGPKLVRQSTFVAPERTLKLVRLVMPKAFIEASVWTDLCQRPFATAGRFFGVPLFKDGQWIEQTIAGETILVGYVQVEHKHLDRLLKNGGQHGCFVERLARDQPARQQGVWVAPEEDVGVGYLAKVRKAAGSLPLAFRKGGGASLGYRVPMEQTIAAKATWRVHRHLPGGSSETMAHHSASGRRRRPTRHPRRGRLRSVAA